MRKKVLSGLITSSFVLAWLMFAADVICSNVIDTTWFRVYYLTILLVHIYVSARIDVYKRKISQLKASRKRREQIRRQFMIDYERFMREYHRNKE